SRPLVVRAGLADRARRTAAPSVGKAGSGGRLAHVSAAPHFVVVRLWALLHRAVAAVRCLHRGKAGNVVGSGDPAALSVGGPGGRFLLRRRVPGGLSPFPSVAVRGAELAGGAVPDDDLFRHRAGALVPSRSAADGLVEPVAKRRRAGSACPPGRDRDGGPRS